MTTRWFHGQCELWKKKYKSLRSIFCWWLKIQQYSERIDFVLVIWLVKISESAKDLLSYGFFWITEFSWRQQHMYDQLIVYQLTWNFMKVNEREEKNRKYSCQSNFFFFFLNFHFFQKFTFIFIKVKSLFCFLKFFWFVLFKKKKYIHIEQL